MADTDKLKAYTPKDFPSIEGGQASYIKSELQSLKVCLNLITTVCSELEDRIDTVEASVADHETRVDTLEATAADHETRISALEP